MTRATARGIRRCPHRVLVNPRHERHAPPIRKHPAGTARGQAPIERCPGKGHGSERTNRKKPPRPFASNCIRCIPLVMTSGPASGTQTPPDKSVDR